MRKAIAFIGAGNMGGAIIRAVCRVVPPEEVWIYDVLPEKSLSLSQETGCRVAANGREAVDGAEYVLLCVKPQYYRETLRELLPALQENAPAGQVLASIVAGVKIETLAGILEEAGLEMPIIRVMPNTPAAIGQGVMLVAAGAGVDGKTLEGFCALLSGCGRVIRMQEQMLDLSTPVSGCGPAFVYLFLDALADGAVQIGVPRDQARTLAAQTVLGSAAMVLESGEHPGALKDAVCSPAGSTIVGVEALEERGFRYAVARAVVAAYERNCQLG